MSEVKGTKALELWCKRLIRDCPEVQIDNMTTSWRNGMAFCALVHHFRPDLIDISKLKPENIYENNQLAYNIAEKHLGIPSLLDPEDMVENEVPDRLSILTYLSQFYQRLGHTVISKVSENDSKTPSTPTTLGCQSTPIKLGKVALDKCAVCGLPVYLAQRLMVAQKLYHRRCFRCSKCMGHLNPKNYHIIDSISFSCDSCKNEKSLPKLNNNNQIGMLAFNSNMSPSHSTQIEESVNRNIKAKPQSILEKINLFEKNLGDSNIENKLANINIRENFNNTYKDVYKLSNIENLSKETENVKIKDMEDNIKESENNQINNQNMYKNIPEKVYTTSKDKLDFLQTQLNDGSLDSSTLNEMVEPAHTSSEDIKHVSNIQETNNVSLNKDDSNIIDNCNIADDSNINDDKRIALENKVAEDSSNFETQTNDQIQQEIRLTVPPRRKKQFINEQKMKATVAVEEEMLPVLEKKYPLHLNPFSDDDDDEHEQGGPVNRKVSTNPFGSSDEEDEVPSTTIDSSDQTSTPLKRHIKALNPFWSDGEEPSSDDESEDKSSNIHKSPMTSSTPNLPTSARRRKPKAPPPPIREHLDLPSTSMDDVASISSLSSLNSTVHSDQKSFGKTTPKLNKRGPVPTPPDSISTASGHGGSVEKGVDSLGIRNTSDGARKVKGPAPGLPLPERREVKMQISAEELQVQLDLLETQQLGLERQGVLIEQMIRDKCEGDDGPTAPQEEIEDLVIQLCELVNEKNDLFRKQTELMYIRRQQRLEQEQADIEHEIRVIQSQPAVNRVDADKAREEQLVTRMVEIVRLRDELVQQLDAERRRERQEDLAIAASIATKRAQRNSESNSSSMKSSEAVTPVKKNKVKDKVKKQFKKAKHTLISKKKDEDKPEKEKKPK